MKLYQLILLSLAIASVKLASSEVTTEISTKTQTEAAVLPGYGYAKTDDIVKSDTAVNKDEPRSVETEKPVKKETPAAKTPVKEAPAAKAPAKKAPVEPVTPAAPSHPDWYKMECTHVTLYKTGIPFDEMCAVASAICSGDFANFYKLYYCVLNQSIIGLIVVYSVLIFLIFKWTGIVVDEYICAGITIMSTTWKLPEAVAAVTLLALANGAGDVITALVAGSAPGGVSYNIGALYGAGLFVAIPVMCACILKNKDGIMYEPVIIFRDIGIYILSTVITLLFATAGAIYWWMAVLFLGVYIVLVIAAIIINKKGMLKLENWVKPKEKAAPAPLSLTTMFSAVSKHLSDRTSWVQLKRD